MIKKFTKVGEVDENTEEKVLNLCFINIYRFN